MFRFQTMTRCCLFIALATGLAVAQAPKPTGKMLDNPLYKHWKQFKPGTSVTLESVSKVAGTENKSEMTYTLIEVKEDKAVVEMKTTTFAAGQKFAQPGIKQDVAAKIPEYKTDAAEQKVDHKTTNGEETIDVGGKKVACKWTQVVMKQNGMNTTTKTWTSDDVPGMTAKSETTMSGQMAMKTTMVVKSMTVKK